MLLAELRDRILSSALDPVVIEYSFVEEGFSTLIEYLAHGLDIRLGHVVQNIEYNRRGVTVQCTVDGRKQKFEADVCLSTLSLGVLKQSVKSSNAQDNEAPIFIPSLPKWKRSAIEMLGFGNLNKVVLIFEKPFWEDVQIFGRITDSSSSFTRGEMYFCQAFDRKPAITVMLSGDAARISEQVSKQAMISNALEILSSLFGPLCPKAPLDAFVTRWQSDPFSRGAFSYMTPECPDDIHDLLARSIADETGVNRVFFAGEHTCSKYPSTVHGAFISGAREAGRIADQLLGSVCNPFLRQ